MSPSTAGPTGRWRTPSRTPASTPACRGSPSRAAASTWRSPTTTSATPRSPTDLARADLLGLRFRDRVAYAVMRRLELVAGEREAVRRGVALFALPHHAADGARAIWHTADTIWNALGDDEPRLRLVHASAPRCRRSIPRRCSTGWATTAPAPRRPASSSARRIDNVMQIEQVKAQAPRQPARRRRCSRAPQAILDRVRAPGILPPPICRDPGAAGTEARPGRRGRLHGARARAVLTWFEGRWHDGNLAVMGAADHGTWQGTLVFDGARAFEGVTPDLDLHCARLIRSAEAMGLAPPLDRRRGRGAGARRHPPARQRPAALPAADDVVARGLARDRSTRCPSRPCWRSASRTCRSATPGPMALTVSPFRRPPPDAALCEAKAACHYPNNARIVREARARGFHNALSLDQAGPCRRDRLDQRLPGARRRGDDAGAERHLPRTASPGSG